jgi:hypothetical protein
MMAKKRKEQAEKEMAVKEQRQEILSSIQPET